jgi:hypothetical protein
LWESNCGTTPGRAGGRRGNDGSPLPLLGLACWAVGGRPQRQLAQLAYFSTMGPGWRPCAGRGAGQRLATGSTSETSGRTPARCGIRGWPGERDVLRDAHISRLIAPRMPDTGERQPGRGGAAGPAQQSMPGVARDLPGRRAATGMTATHTAMAADARPTVAAAGDAVRPVQRRVTQARRQHLDPGGGLRYPARPRGRTRRPTGPPFVPAYCTSTRLYCVPREWGMTAPLAGCRRAQCTPAGRLWSGGYPLSTP